MTSGFDITSARRAGADQGAEQAVPAVEGEGEYAGKIEVSSRAIATIAGRAVSQVYGVVGIAAKHPRLAMVETLAPEHYSRGVDVHFGQDQVSIELYVVLEHGLRISEIARNIMDTVKFAVEQALGVRVVHVNVNVQALRVGDESQ